MLENKISQSLPILEKIKNDTNWSGSAASTFNEDITNLITSLKTGVADLETFQGALDILDEIKALDVSIANLRESEAIKSTDVDSISVDDESKEDILYLLNSKVNKRNSLRTQAINILSKFGIIADICVIEISDVEGAVILTSYEKGAIYELTTSNGKSYVAYIPYQVDPTSPVIVYDSGGNSGDAVPSSTDWNAMFKPYFEENGFDHIVIKSMRNDNSLYYNDLCDRLDLEPESRLFISHSGGFASQFKEYYQLLKEDTESVPGVLAMMDGYIYNDDSMLAEIAETDTVLLCFHQSNPGGESLDYYMKHIEKGLKMIILSDESQYGQTHAGVRNSLTENGVLDYLTGTGKLPDNYKISYYDTELGELVTVDYSDVSTIEDVYKFFGIKK